jgi:hypothetical protein
VALSLTPAFAGAAGRYPAPWFHGARTFLVGASSTATAQPSGEAAYRGKPLPLRVIAPMSAMGGKRTVAN